MMRQLLKHITLRNVVIVKTIVCVGILAAYMLPQQYAMAVGAASNLLWLWKT